MPLYIIEDYQDNDDLIQRQYIEANTPEQARIKAGTMPGYRRVTMPSKLAPND